MNDFPRFDLRAQTALVTGAARGLGRAIALALAHAGADVALGLRDVNTAADLASEIAAMGRKVFRLQMDMASMKQISSAIEKAVSRLGRLDILVNNAGGPARGGRVEEISLEAFDRAIAVHVRGALAHMKYAAPIMRGQRSGSIVNIGSIAGHRAGYSSSLIYGTAKAALIHMSRCAAMELGEDGVRVNSISPGAIATGIFGKAMGLDHAEADKSAERIKVPFAGMQAIPRAGIVDDIANACLFLASDEAGFITAEDLVIDGGVIWGRRFSEPAPGVAAMRKLLQEG